MEISHRINEQIRTSTVRLVTEDGRALGILPTAEAQKMALQAGVDLVEVAANVQPPVCRIMDYGKFSDEQKKKRAECEERHREQGEGDPPR